MDVKVIYQSRGGNTKMLAEAIASEVGVSPQPTTQGMRGRADLLLVGGALYAGKPDKALVSFLDGLSKEDVSQAAIFGTATSDNNIGETLLPMLESRGIKVLGEYYCKGKFLMMNRKHPDEQDLKRGKVFASQMMALATKVEQGDSAKGGESDKN